jgi:hypothetical protein
MATAPGMPLHSTNNARKTIRNHSRIPLMTDLTTGWVANARRTIARFCVGFGLSTAVQVTLVAHRSKWQHQFEERAREQGKVLDT